MRSGPTDVQRRRQRHRTGRRGQRNVIGQTAPADGPLAGSEDAPYQRREEGKVQGCCSEEREPSFIYGEQWLSSAIIIIDSVADFCGWRRKIEQKQFCKSPATKMAGQRSAQQS